MAIALSGSNSDGKHLPGTSSSVANEDADGGLGDSGRSATVNKAGSTSPSSSSGTESKKGANEMIGGCAVCLDENGVEGNPLVYCDGCELAVHQACYGIAKIPSGNWYCCRCASGNTKIKIKCELCPVEDGALKKTETGSWAHVLCALYIPEVFFGSLETMEPIILKKIIPDRYKAICYICEDSGNTEAASYGAKLECHLKGCKKHFHITCAQTSGLLREEATPGSDTINYCGYCKLHFRKSKAPINNNSKKKVCSFTSDSSSMLDYASDSSQDNDPRRNDAIEQDKNNSNRTKVLPTKNISQSEVISTTPTNISQSLSSTALTKPTTLQTNPSLLDAHLDSVSGNGSKSYPSSTPSSTPKKKRAPKSGQGQNNMIEHPSSNNSGSLLGTDSNNLSAQQKPASASITNHNVYDWPTGDRNLEINTSTLNKNNRKKPSSSSPQTLNSKTALSTTTQQVVPNSYNPNKVGSPNLSISTSPSLASPSSSTQSTSNSSTSSTSSATATAIASSSSSTTSSSPSPALLSPSISNRGNASRQESPLASNSKISLNLNNKQAPESILTACNNPSAPNQLNSSRINLDNPRPDMKKSLASSSLLSTVQMSPMENLISLGNAGDVASSLMTNVPGSTDVHAKEFITTTLATSKPETAQPTVPPLIIPVPQGSTNNSPSKPTSKAKAPARNTKKKAAESSASAPPTADPAPKQDPKSKPSRSKKTASSDSTTSVSQKAKPKSRKGKTNTSPEALIASSSSTGQDGDTPKVLATPGPNKRKSRAISAESNPSTAPAPAKRIRKKKTDGPPSESKSTTQTALPTNSQPSMSHLSGAGPLTISTPAQNNPLPPGFNPSEGQMVGPRYFSPVVSPYTNYDGQMAASSLSRSSLSRLFTSSSSGANSNPANQPLDDPTKAFDELREHGWSQLSKCVLEQAQQFDIPLLIGTLHTLRMENEKLQNRVRDLTLKREQLAAMNARLDLPPQLLTQNLTNTNPSFSSIVSSLTNSPKSLPIPSPGSAIGKQPLVITSSYNHMGSGHLGPPSFMDRSSPLVAQTHSTLNNIKSSSISTPSPPINALMAAHNNSNRAGLTVNQPYMPNPYPQMNATGQINSNPQGPSFYARQ